MKKDETYREGESKKLNQNNDNNEENVIIY